MSFSRANTIPCGAPGYRLLSAAAQLVYDGG